MNQLLPPALSSNPLFGLVLTLTCYGISRMLYLRTGQPLLNPIFVSLLIILGVLQFLGIPVEHYMAGGSIISAFLPVTVMILALPLYKQLPVLVKYRWAVLGGAGAGVLTSLVSVTVLAKLLGLSPDLIRALIPKSITTPLGVEMAGFLEASRSLTVISIVATGIIGVLVYPLVFRLFRISHPAARGLALGTASHAVGTSKALELGHQEGAMSSLAIIVTGLVTLGMTPLVILLLGIIL